MLMVLRKLHIWLQLVAWHWQGPPGTVLRRHTWEALQTWVGFWVATLALVLFPVRKIERAFGAIVLEVDTGKPFWGGICFGTVILGDQRIGARINNHLFMHEFGHSLQSRLSGPLYLFKYGLPSVFSARRKGRHAFHPVEQDANRRAEAFFAPLAGFEPWPNYYNPILQESCLMPLRWWEFVPGVYPVFHLVQAFRLPPA